MTQHDSRLGSSERISAAQHPDIEEVCRLIAGKSFCMLPAEQVRALVLQRGANSLSDWPAFRESWSQLPLDHYMADGGRYRRRRHATLSAPASSLSVRVESHQPHYQSINYNALNGGVARQLEPIEDSVLRGETMLSFLTLGCEIFGRLSPYSAWHIEVHQFRIEADGVHAALPTPEGRHRDGVSFAMMVMVRRVNITRGTTAIFDLEGQALDEFALTDPLDMALVNDERVQHAVTPIKPINAGQPAYRDVLVATFRYRQDLITR